jgi:hypothetical protein
MKISGLFFTLLFFSMYAHSQSVTSTPQPAPASQPVLDITKVLKFNNTEFDLGKIPFGKPVKFTLEATNISKDTVTLENVQVGCGCTTPDYVKGEKFGPNKKAIINLGFNGGTHGNFYKYVTVFFSGGLQQQIHFKGETYEVPATSTPANNATQNISNSPKN